MKIQREWVQMDRLTEFQQLIGTKQPQPDLTRGKIKASPEDEKGSQIKMFFAPFQKAAQSDAERMERGESKQPREPIPPVMSNSDEEMQMPRFFVQVIEVKDGNRRVRLLTDEIQKLHKQALQGEDKDDGLKVKIEALMKKVDQINNGTRALLKDMETVTDGLKSLSSAKSSANVRMRESNHLQLSQQFIETIRRYQDMQKKFQEKYRANLIRQYLIVNPDASKSQLDELAQDPETMRQSIFTLRVKDEAKKNLEEMKDRLEDFENIERRIMELSQLMIEMQDMVLSQGEMINRVGFHVAAIEDYVEEAKKSMENAVASQKTISSLKRKIALIVLIVTIVIVGFITFQLILVIVRTRAIFRSLKDG